MRNNGSVISLEARLVAFNDFSCLDGETSSDTPIQNWEADCEMSGNGACDALHHHAYTARNTGYGFVMCAQSLE